MLNLCIIKKVQTLSYYVDIKDVEKYIALKDVHLFVRTCKFEVLQTAQLAPSNYSFLAQTIKKETVNFEGSYMLVFDL